MPTESPVQVKNVHADPNYRSDILVEARLAVLRDVGKYVPMISLEKFLKHLIPPRPNFDLEATIRSLKSGSEPALTSSNQWAEFTVLPKHSRDPEDRVFNPMPEIFTKVVAGIIENSGGNLTEENRTLDFLQNPSQAPTSAERHNESRPDGYMVRRVRYKPMSSDGKKEVIHWADIALSCEYKRKDGPDDLNDVRIHQGL